MATEVTERLRRQVAERAYHWAALSRHAVQAESRIPGEIHHVVDRGDRREGIFFDDANRQRAGMEHDGAERAETAEARAERLIAEELKRRRWQWRRACEPRRR